MKKVLHNWNIIRLFRLAMAIFLVFNAYETRQWWFALFGLFFLVQAIFNLGCGNNGCNIDYDKNK
jgi:hypothetical protein